MKLEIKHIAPYLPYGLKGVLISDLRDEFSDLDWVDNIGIFKKGSIWEYAGHADEDLAIPLEKGEFSGFLIKKGNSYASVGNSVKPILRPMTDIIKPIKDLDATYMSEIWGLRTQKTSGIFEGYSIENNTATMTFGSFQHPNSDIEFKDYFEIDLEPEDITFALTMQTTKNNTVINEELYLLGNEFKMYQKLFEYHFDVFGLIEKGLAIDINTVEL